MATKQIIGSNNKDVKKCVVWLDGTEDCPGEPALLIEGYGDSLYIQQGNNNVLINWSDLKEVLKAIKSVTPSE